VLGTLVDLAVAEGRIASIDLPITTWLPELRDRDPRFDQVLLRHLLNMHAGLAYTEYPFPTSDGAKTYYWPDLRALVLTGTRIAEPPGRIWLYNNDHPLLIGLVLERSTGMPVSTFLEQRLWQPAGMAAAASWSLDSEASGFEKLESRINARTRDFARFGQLFVDGAVPIEQYRPGAYDRHFWWGQRRDDGSHDFSARGNHGQFVFVSPRNQIGIAGNGREYRVQPREWIRLFEDVVDRLGTDAER
jgi:CubicO group peptidase (beta-lactamase class C family)